MVDRLERLEPEDLSGLLLQVVQLEDLEPVESKIVRLVVLQSVL